MGRKNARHVRGEKSPTRFFIFRRFEFFNFVCVSLDFCICEIRSMNNAGCRISRVRMKGGGDIVIYPRRDVGECSKAPEALSSIIDNRSLMVGFFVLRKDRTAAFGWSHEAGVTLPDALGGCEALKTELLDRF